MLNYLLPNRLRACTAKRKGVTAWVTPTDVGDHAILIGSELADDADLAPRASLYMQNAIRKRREWRAAGYFLNCRGRLVAARTFRVGTSTEATDVVFGYHDTRTRWESADPGVEERRRNVALVLQSAVRNSPFRRFRIACVFAQEVDVVSPWLSQVDVVSADRIALAPSGSQLCVYQPDDSLVKIDVWKIVDLEFV